MSAGFADLLSLSGVWLPSGTAPAPEAGWRGVLAMCGVWIDGGTTYVPPTPGGADSDYIIRARRRGRRSGR